MGSHWINVFGYLCAEAARKVITIEITLYEKILDFCSRFVLKARKSLINNIDNLLMRIRSLWVEARVYYIPVTAFSWTDLLLDRIFSGMRLPWECHGQLLQESNWRHCVTGPELPFSHKIKGILKIDQSIRMTWHGLSMEVACSYSSAPARIHETKRKLLTAAKNALPERQGFCWKGRKEEKHWDLGWRSR